MIVTDSAWRWPRLLIAYLITFLALPYPYGRFLVFALNGAIDVRLAGGVALAVFALFALTWRLRMPLGGLGILVAWCLTLGGLVTWVAAPRMPLWLLLVVFVPGTIWVVWLAWFTAWPMRSTARFGLLTFWLAVGALAPTLIVVDGMTGETTTASPTLIFNWRQFRARTLESATERAELAAPSPDDFPQYLGPHRTGAIATKVAGDWAATPPRELWRRPMGEGWGGFAIVGGYAFTQEQRGPNESVTCYRLSDGHPIWVHSDPVRYEGIGGPGPRATPSVADGRVFSVGATGILNCLDAATGTVAWSVELLKTGDRNDTHGACASPLVDGERVIVCPPGRAGPTLAAFDRQTGKPLWTNGEDRPSYGSPMIAELCGVPQIVLFHAAGVGGYDRSTGKPLWGFAWSNQEHINAAQPIVRNGPPGGIFAATGYGKGATAVRVTHSASGEWEVEPVWSNLRLKAKFMTPVLYEGHVYGLDDGILTCLDPVTGKQKWKEGRYNHGQILLAGDRLIVQTEPGSVVLVEPSPANLIERGRIEALSSKTWNNPALSGRYLLLRNDREAACYELPSP